MKLYFQHANGRMSIANNDVDETNVMAAIVEDLRRRNPKFKSPFVRTWKDAKGWNWYDVGDYRCFYVLKND